MLRDRQVSLEDSRRPTGDAQRRSDGFHHGIMYSIPRIMHQSLLKDSPLVEPAPEQRRSRSPEVIV